MKLIERKFYLQQPINVMNTPDIKVISGIRGGDNSYPYGSENSSATFGRNKFLTEIKYNFCCKEYILYVRISPRETSR